VSNSKTESVLVCRVMGQCRKVCLINHTTAGREWCTMLPSMQLEWLSTNASS